MMSQKLPLQAVQSFSTLITHFLEKSEGIHPFAGQFPDLEDLVNSISEIQFSADKRQTLSTVLESQYQGIALSEPVRANLQSLASDHTYTVTTGHQLCLFTGPAYTIYKILSTIKLAQILQEKVIDKHIVPVFWMATEDHDFEEVNHAYLFGKRLSWDDKQGGAVGRYSTDSLSEAVNQFAQLAGNSHEAKAITELVQKAYSLPTLADATRYLINALFGKYGLIIIDADHKDLKTFFAPVALEELQHATTKKLVDATNDQLRQSGYEVQVNPREVNLFYISKNLRARIERTDENKWTLHGESISWSAHEVQQLVQQNPETISPNVLLRPIYQQIVLPNIAYIGGPGELAYWLQLKDLFAHYKAHYPSLILRDSAVFITQKNAKRLAKLGLSFTDLLQPKEQLIKHLIGAEQPMLELQKKELQQWFEAVAQKAKNTDSTLESAARAELQKWLTGLDALEKRMLKAIKQKEEQKIAQLESLFEELFPEGGGQERHDNFFQFQLATQVDLLEELLNSFDPLQQELKVFYLD